MGSAFNSLIHFSHFLGIALLLGGSVAGYVVHAGGRDLEAGPRSGQEIAAAAIITKVELPGLILAILGGVLAVARFPGHLDPTASGAGPWLHVKLIFVLGVVVVAHLRMFRARGLVRLRASGATAKECDVALGRALALGRTDLALMALAFTIATFRFPLFGA